MCRPNFSRSCIDAAVFKICVTILFSDWRLEYVLYDSLRVDFNEELLLISVFAILTGFVVIQICAANFASETSASLREHRSSIATFLTFHKNSRHPINSPVRHPNSRTTKTPPTFAIPNSAALSLAVDVSSLHRPIGSGVDLKIEKTFYKLEHHKKGVYDFFVWPPFYFTTTAVDIFYS